MSAEVCAAASNHSELLKCLQVLVGQLHPALAMELDLDQGPRPALKQEELRQQPVPPEEEAPPSPPSYVEDTSVAHDGGGSCVNPTGSGLGGDGGGSRRAEFVAAQLLFFACVPSAPSRLDTLSVLRGASGGGASASALPDPGSGEALHRHAAVFPGDAASSTLDSLPAALASLDLSPTLGRSPPPCWGHVHVQYAVSLLRALSAPDPAAFLALASAAPTPLLGALAGAAAGRARLALLRTLASAYRTLPWEVATHCLGWHGAAPPNQPGAFGHHRGGGPGSAPTLSVSREQQPLGGAVKGVGGGEATTTPASPRPADSGISAAARPPLAAAPWQPPLAALLREAAGKGCRGSATALSAMAGAWERADGGGMYPDLVFKS